MMDNNLLWQATSCWWRATWGGVDLPSDSPFSVPFCHASNCRSKVRVLYHCNLLKVKGLMLTSNGLRANRWTSVPAIYTLHRPSVGGGNFPPTHSGKYDTSRNWIMKPQGTGWQLQKWSVTTTLINCTQNMEQKKKHSFSSAARESSNFKNTQVKTCHTKNCWNCISACSLILKHLAWELKGFQDWFKPTNLAKGSSKIYQQESQQP